jgi:hypothetical protein
VADLSNFKQKERSKHFLGMGFNNSRPFSMEVGRRKTRRKVHLPFPQFINKQLRCEFKKLSVSLW